MSTDQVIPVPSPEIHDDGSTDERISAAEHAHVNVTRIEMSERVLSTIAIVASVAALVTSLWSIHESDRAAREAKQLQIQVMDHNALLLRAGILLPSDETYGPAGNLTYQPPKKGK